MGTYIVLNLEYSNLLTGLLCLKHSLGIFFIIDDGVNYACLFLFRGAVIPKLSTITLPPGSAVQPSLALLRSYLVHHKIDASYVF